jgi:pyrimidine-specific ribonucleoside hydrolase
MVMAMVGLAAGCADDAEPALVDPVSEPTMAPDAGLVVTDSVSEGMPVVLDYSPTISDIGALFYLASHPDVDLLAVTLPERGESDCDLGVTHTRSLLSIAGRLDVPVGCGVEPPLVGDRDWPDEFRQYSNLLAGVVLPIVTPGLPVDGAALLADTLRSADRPVTIVAVGPLTNLGVVFRDQPELVGHVERVVIMGGAVDVPGNVEAAPTAEWNLYIDPQAARLVLASGVDVLLVPLDATNDVPWTDALVAQLALLESAVGKSERQVVASRGFTDGIYLWDELAAVATLQPEMLQIERRTIVVDDDGATLDAPSGASVDVAVGADADAATREFLRILNGGVLPTIPDGSPEEHAYFDHLEAGLSEFASAGESVYVETASDAHTEADRFIVTVSEALGLLASVIDSVDPPGLLAADHVQLSVAINSIVDQMDDLRAAIAEAEGDDAFTLISAGIKETEVEQSFDDLDVACASIAEYLVLRAGSLSCPGLGSDE